ncbi:hypothetical protein RQP46_000590 [Phenoliferia psychrophenolica]
MPTTVTPVVPRGRTDENIYLFVPNLIGYLRVVLAAVSLAYMSTHPKVCTLTYSISCLLDAADGQAARALGQTSKFGAILDMVTDRCTTSCLLCYLASTYPSYALLFQFLISLDFSSHYIHMYASLLSGSTSHKSVTKEQSWILWSYYNNSTTLFLFCFGNELFFVALYLVEWTQHHTIGLESLVLRLSDYPELLAVIKQVPGHAAALRVVANLTWPQVIAAVSFPVCAMKQAINCVQFWKASKVLVEADQMERWEKLQAKKL